MASMSKGKSSKPTKTETSKRKEKKPVENPLRAIPGSKEFERYKKQVNANRDRYSANVIKYYNTATE